MYLNEDDRGGHSPADIAARLSSPDTLTEQDIHWSAGANDPTWVAPRQPVQQIIKVLAKLEHVGGYRRPRDVFSDWLDLVEATLHMLPQQLLYLRMHQTFMPPDQEPPRIQEVFKRVMRPYGDRWNEAQKLFQEAYGILTEAAHGMVFDALGAISMALEIGNARAGQYFSPWAIATTSAKRSIPGQAVRRTSSWGCSGAARTPQPRAGFGKSTSIRCTI